MNFNFDWLVGWLVDTHATMGCPGITWRPTRVTSARPGGKRPPATTKARGHGRIRQQPGGRPRRGEGHQGSQGQPLVKR